MVAGKARVHELAKELGVTSKELLAKLKEQGHFVKSASSTVERPVADRLRAAFGQSSRRQSHHSIDEQTAGPDRRGQRTVIITPPPETTAPAVLTDSQLADLCRDYRRAYADQKPDVAINKVFNKYQRQYRVSRQVLRNAVSKDKHRNIGVYTALRLARTPEAHAPTRPAPQQRVIATRRDEHRRDPAPSRQAPTPRPRTRRAGLPPAESGFHGDAIADIVATTDTSHTREQIAADLAPFHSTAIDRYGYLGWRYATTHRYPAQPAPTPGDELATIARIVDTSKLRLQHIHDTTGQVLEHPNLAPRALESGFGDLFDPDDIGRAASDERRRVMHMHAFLQRAVVLIIANPQCADRLWDMLNQLQPPPQHTLFETTPLLRTSIEALTDDLAAVEALLSSDDATLQQFAHRSHTELTDLNNGRFDYFQQFRDAGSQTTRRVISGLGYTVLPQGVHIRTFLNDPHAAKHFHIRHRDDNRLSVLEELQDHFGAHRCIWHIGSVTSNGVDNRYLVLSIASTTGPDESAVAISPLAGEHATYLVRPECADAHWARIFELTKEEARQHGARRLFFRGDADQYTDMRDRIIGLLEGDPRDFHR